MILRKELKVPVTTTTSRITSAFSAASLPEAQSQSEEKIPSAIFDTLTVKDMAAIPESNLIVILRTHGTFFICDGKEIPKIQILDANSVNTRIVAEYQLDQELDEHIELRALRQLQRHYPDTSYVFVSGRKTPLSAIPRGRPYARISE